MNAGSNLKSIDSSTLLVTGVVRDCAVHLRSDVDTLRSAVGDFRTVYWLLIESDSSDDSAAVLEEIKSTVDNFDAISLGQLRGELPQRTARIAHCRNRYVSELRSNPRYRDVDFVLVADFDGINTQISAQAVASCWSRTDWDVCTANQAGPYSDIWALRHREWCNTDCWAEYEFLRQFINDDERARDIAIFSKMLTIPKDSDWIEVDSAFGGLAIYRKDNFLASEYDGLTADNREICEHVTFHHGLRVAGRRIFINPRLINTAMTEHSADMASRSKTRNLFKNFLYSLLGKQRVRRFLQNFESH